MIDFEPGNGLQGLCLSALGLNLASRGDNTSPDHLLNQCGLVETLDLVGRDELAVTQDRDPIAAREDLAHAV